MNRVHIIGSSPRSGTTLLAESLTACAAIDVSAEHERSIIFPDPPGDGVHLTKQPGELLSVLWPLAVDPDLWVICCVRDPRDAAVSRHGSRPDAYWCGFRYWKLFLRHHRRLVSSPRVMLIRYEDLTREPDAVQSRLAAFLPFLEMRYPFSEFHRVARPHGRSFEALREVRPIAPSGIGARRQHLPRIKQQTRIHGSVAPSLVAHGYEPDAAWEAMLDGVEAGDFETVVGSTTTCGTWSIGGCGDCGRRGRLRHRAGGLLHRRQTVPRGRDYKLPGELRHEIHSTGRGTRGVTAPVRPDG